MLHWVTVFFPVSLASSLMVIICSHILISVLDSHFSKALNCTIKLFGWGHCYVFFLILACLAVNFPLKVFSLLTMRFIYCILIFGISLLISTMTHFHSMLFSLHDIGYSLSFLLLLVFTFMPLCSNRIKAVTSIFPCLLTFTLCPNVWSFFETVPRAVKKNMYSIVFRWTAVQMSARAIWPMLSLNSDVSGWYEWLVSSCEWEL